MVFDVGKFFSQNVFICKITRENKTKRRVKERVEKMAGRWPGRNRRSIENVKGRQGEREKGRIGGKEIGRNGGKEERDKGRKGRKGRNGRKGGKEERKKKGSGTENNKTYCAITYV